LTHLVLIHLSANTVCSKSYAEILTPLRDLTSRILQVKSSHMPQLQGHNGTARAKIHFFKRPRVYPFRCAPHCHQKS